MDKLAGQVFDLEKTIGDAFSVDKSPDSNAITNLQALDFLRQSLEDLALLVLSLGKEDLTSLDTDELDKLAQKLKLNATRSLLVETSHGHFGENRQKTDDLDLF